MACIPHVFFPVEHFLLVLNGVVLLAAIGEDGHRFKEALCPNHTKTVAVVTV